MTGITGLRLEVLPDARLPNQGPGRATDGNFVLNEIEVTAAPKADPKQAKPVKLEKALADFSQAGFEIAKAIDGVRNNPGNGWAVAPATGTTHWATFETAAARRRGRGHGADLQADALLPGGVDAGPVSHFGHAQWQTRGADPARRLPRDPRRGARAAQRCPEEDPGDVFPVHGSRAAGEV